MIVVGASTAGKVARKVLGSVPLELIQRARRPVLVDHPVRRKGAPHGHRLRSERRKGLFADQARPTRSSRDTEEEGSAAAARRSACST